MVTAANVCVALPQGRCFRTERCTSGHVKRQAGLHGLRLSGPVGGARVKLPVIARSWCFSCVAQIYPLLSAKDYSAKCGMWRPQLACMTGISSYISCNSPRLACVRRANSRVRPFECSLDRAVLCCLLLNGSPSFSHQGCCLRAGLHSLHCWGVSLPRPKAD